MPQKRFTGFKTEAQQVKLSVKRLIGSKIYIVKIRTSGKYV